MGQRTCARGERSASDAYPSFQIIIATKTTADTIQKVGVIRIPRKTANPTERSARKAFEQAVTKNVA